MGRTEPTVVVQPQAFRRDARSKQAKATVNKTIPGLLVSHPRARRGIDTAELIVDPPPATDTAATTTTSGKSSGATPRLQPVQIRLLAADTLDAASLLLRANSSPNKQKKPTVAVLNMASPLRPGGGFLEGATSQEERLCMRTTLYPSLRDSFYRLPEVGGIYTPDVMAFRDSTTEFKDLPKKDRFFVDVITAGMLRFPDTEGEEGEERRYASNKDRELVGRKMRAVLRMARAKGVDMIVLGAWGCGAYGNPVGEVARAWKKLLCGGESKKGKGGKTNGLAERWDGMEVVFAIKESRMAEDFAEAFGAGLVFEHGAAACEDSIEDEGSDKGTEEMEAKIAEMESQILHVRNPDLKARLDVVLAGLKTQLAERSGTETARNADDEEDDEQQDLEDASSTHDSFSSYGYDISGDEETASGVEQAHSGHE